MNVNPSKEMAADPTTPGRPMTQSVIPTSFQSAGIETSPSSDISISPSVHLEKYPSATSQIDRRKPVGLFAGWGRFPLVFAEKARSLGLDVVCVGIREEASPELARWCHKFYWARAAQLGR